MGANMQLCKIIISIFSNGEFISNANLELTLKVPCVKFIKIIKPNSFLLQAF